MKTPLKLKVKVLLRAVKTVLMNPKYTVIAVVSSVLMAGAIIWSLNWELLSYILFDSPLTLAGKVEFFSYGYRSLFTTLDSMLSLSIVIFTVLFGINMALLVYVIRRSGFKSIPKKSGGGAFVFAILGGGCIACGTSLLTPIIASFGAVSAPLMRDLGAIFNWLGSILLLYSIYKLSTLVVTKK